MYSLSIVCKWNVSIDACSLLTGLAIDYIVKYKTNKTKSGLTFWIRFYMCLDDMSFALAWLSATDFLFFFCFFFCFWKWTRKLRIFYFAYSQSHSSRSDHGGQECWYFLRVECILLKLQNLASLGAEFVPRSLLQRFFFVPRPLLKSVLSSERYTSIHRLNLDYTSQWCEPGFVYGIKITI